MSLNTGQIAEIILSYKNNIALPNHPIISQSKDAYTVFLDAWDADKIGFVEQSKVLLLNQANRVLGIYELSTGGVTGTVCDPKLVFVAALKANACNIILAHNHPSESLKPSNADKTLTRKLKDAGYLLDIHVLDHLIISPKGFYSFSDDAVTTLEEINKSNHKLFSNVQSFASEKEVSMTANNQLQMFADNGSSTYPLPMIRSSDAYAFLRQIWEQKDGILTSGYRILFMDNERCLTAWQQLSLNKADTCFYDTNKVMAMATKIKAQHFILAHCKPYGVVLPNKANLEFVEALKCAGEENKVYLYDYLLLNGDGYYSYTENEFHVIGKPQPL